MRKLISIRRTCPELGWGTWSVVEQPVERVLVQRCDIDGSAVVTIHNLGADPATVEVPVDPEGEGLEAIDLMSDEVVTGDRPRPWCSRATDTAGCGCDLRATSRSREACRVGAVTTEQVWLGVVGALALVSLALALGARRRAVRAESLVASLTDRIALLEAPATTSRPVPEESTYVITRMDAATGSRAGDPGRAATSTVVCSPTSWRARPSYELRRGPTGCAARCRRRTATGSASRYARRPGVPAVTVAPRPSGPCASSGHANVPPARSTTSRATSPEPPRPYEFFGKTGREMTSPRRLRP